MIEDAETIFVYSRREALEDGVLIDATKMAKVAGFKWPVAVTATAWAEYVGVPEGIDWQNETDRLWDILTALRYAIWKSSHDRDCIPFDVKLAMGGGHSSSIPFKAVSGPDDHGKPCITIMRPDED